MASMRPTWFTNLSNVNPALIKIYSDKDNLQSFLIWKENAGAQFAPDFDRFNIAIRDALGINSGAFGTKTKIDGFNEAIRWGASDDLLTYLLFNPNVNKVFEAEFAKPNSPVIMGLNAYTKFYTPAADKKTEEKKEEIKKTEQEKQDRIKKAIDDFKFTDLSTVTTSAQAPASEVTAITAPIKRSAKTPSKAPKVIIHRHGDTVEVTADAYSASFCSRKGSYREGDPRFPGKFNRFFNKELESKTAASWVNVVYTEIKNQIKHLLTKQTPEEQAQYAKILTAVKSCWVIDEKGNINFVETKRRLGTHLRDPNSSIRRDLEDKSTQLRAGFLRSTTNAFQRLENALQTHPQMVGFISFTNLTLLTESSSSTSLSSQFK